jgi:hypothetical protein
VCERENVQVQKNNNNKIKCRKSINPLSVSHSPCSGLMLKIQYNEPVKAHLIISDWLHRFKVFNFIFKLLVMQLFHIFNSISAHNGTVKYMLILFFDFNINLIHLLIVVHLLYSNSISNFLKKKTRNYETLNFETTQKLLRLLSFIKIQFFPFLRAHLEKRLVTLQPYLL